MALVPCPECQKEVSTQALACPQCAFPFPGKHSLSEDTHLNKLSSCQDCGFPISKQARSCPHCGVTFTSIGGQALQATNGTATEETWLCPHCGIPYTRKVKPLESVSATPQEAVPTISPETELQISEISKEKDDTHTDVESLLPLCNRSPLWQDPSARKDVSSHPHRYPRSKKKSLIVGLILFVLVTVSIVFGALWQFQGINPLEVLVYWRM